MDTSETNLLVIEDEPIVRESYVDMFELLGYPVDTASNGQEGLNLISRKNYDIVITDLNMPVMDGLETLQRIKQKFPNIEVIVITGFATIENAINAMKQGAFDYITKPISLEHVKVLLNRCRQRISALHENDELKTLNAKLTEINEIKDKFITITNHELRTPLAVLKGYLELIDMSIDDKSDEVSEYFETVTTTLKEMINLVERLHNLSETDRPDQLLEPEVFNLNEEIVTVANEMKILFKQRNIEFGAFTNQKEIMINANRDGIHRAMRELLQNALKFTEEGGKASLRAKREANNKVYISVQDSGIGIPASQLKVIFEPFYEVQDVMNHSTSQTEFMGGGIGVGLSIVRDILQSCNGEIDVQSEEGKGSTFTLILPSE